MIDPLTGDLVQLSLVEGSGVKLFDVAALQALRETFPVSVPTELKDIEAMHLKWEFYRLPAYACSTYFARVHRPPAR